MSGFVCSSFQEHVFRKEICANCRKSKIAHASPAPQPAKRVSITRKSEEREASSPAQKENGTKKPIEKRSPPRSTKTSPESRKSSPESKKISPEGKKPFLKKGKSVDKLDDKSEAKPTVRSSKPKVVRKALSMDVGQNLNKTTANISPTGQKGTRPLQRPPVPPPEAPKMPEKKPLKVNQNIQKTDSVKSEKAKPEGSHYYHKYDVSQRGKLSTNGKSEKPVDKTPLAAPYTVMDVSKVPMEQKPEPEQLAPKLPTSPTPTKAGKGVLGRQRKAVSEKPPAPFPEGGKLANDQKENVPDKLVTKTANTKPDSLPIAKIITQSSEKRLSQDSAYEPISVEETGSNDRPGEVTLKNHQAKMAFLAGAPVDCKKSSEEEVPSSSLESPEMDEKADKKKKSGKSFFDKLLRRGSGSKGEESTQHEDKSLEIRIKSPKRERASMTFGSETKITISAPEVVMSRSLIETTTSASAINLSRNDEGKPKAWLPIDKEVIRHSNPNINVSPASPSVTVPTANNPVDTKRPSTDEPLSVSVDLPPPKPKKTASLKKPAAPPPSVPSIPFSVAVSAPGISPTVATLPEAPKRPNEDHVAFYKPHDGVSGTTIYSSESESKGSFADGDNNAEGQVVLRKNSKAKRSDSRLSNSSRRAMDVPPPPPPLVLPTKEPSPPSNRVGSFIAATLPGSGSSPKKPKSSKSKEPKSPDKPTAKVKSPKVKKGSTRTLDISGPIAVTPMTGGMMVNFSLDDMLSSTKTSSSSKDDNSMPKKRFDSKKKHNRNRTVTEGIDIDIDSLVCDDNEEDVNQLLEGRNSKFVNRALPPPPDEQTPCNKFENFYEFVPSDTSKPRQRECYEDIDSIYDNPAEVVESSSTNSSLSQHSHTVKHTVSDDLYLEPVKTKDDPNDSYPDIIPASALKKKGSVDDSVSSTSSCVSQPHVMPYANVEVSFDENRQVLTTNDAFKKISSLNLETLLQRGEEIFAKFVFPKAKFSDRLKWRDFSIGCNGIELSLGLTGFYKGRCYKVSHKETYLMVSGKSLPKNLLDQGHVHVLSPTGMFKDRISADYFPQPAGTDPKVYKLFGTEQTNIAILGYSSIESLPTYIQVLSRKHKSSPAAFERSACYIMSHILNGLLSLYERNIEVTKVHSNDILIVTSKTDEKYGVVSLTSPPKDVEGNDNQLFDCTITLIFLALKVRWNQREDPYCLITVKSKYSLALKKLVSLLYQKQFTLQSLIMARNIIEFVLWGPSDDEAKLMKASPEGPAQAHSVWLEVARCKLINEMATKTKETTLEHACLLRFMCSMSGRALADTAKIIDINV